MLASTKLAVLAEMEAKTKAGLNRLQYGAKHRGRIDSLGLDAPPRKQPFGLGEAKSNYGPKNSPKSRITPWFSGK